MELDDTVHGQPGFADQLFAKRNHPMRMTFSAATHRGHVRDTNEDQFAVIRRSRVHEVIATSLSDSTLPAQMNEAYLLVIADGIGGGPFGELASQLAVETAFELAGQATSWVMKLTDPDAPQMRERIEAYAERIEARLKEFSAREPRLSGMGTTWASAYIMDDDAVIVNIGDSRVYLCRAGVCGQLTRDHTLAQLLETSGIDPVQVERLRHVLTNCLSGDPGKFSSPEIHHLRLRQGDQLMLCTDGLSDLIDDETIGKVLGSPIEPQESCRDLVGMALERGGRDNVTVIVARFTEAARSAPNETQTFDTSQFASLDELAF